MLPILVETMQDSKLFQWSDDYQIGHKVIDEEHKYLLSLLDELAESIALGDNDRHFIIHTLGELKSYTETHFLNEEALMRQLQYADLEKHAENHKMLFFQVSRLLEEFENGKPVLTPGTLSFLKDWLVNHILNDDLELARLLNR